MANVGDFSVTLTTTPALVLPVPSPLQTLRYHRLFNASSTTDIWCSWTNNSPSVGGLGCYRIGPLSAEEFGNTNTGFVPYVPVYAVAASATANLTAVRY